MLIEITDTDATVYGDPTQGPYDGVEDTLIGVVNDSSKTMGALALTSSTDLFGFDGDGLCTYIACSWAAPTTYEDPNTSFSDISADYSSGVVNFPAGLAAGSSTYFCFCLYLVLLRRRGRCVAALPHSLVTGGTA